MKALARGERARLLKALEEFVNTGDTGADLRHFEKRWPGFKSKIEMTDVPTPMTYVRYTDNWQGSPDGWYITTENMMDQRMKRTLPGLDNLYMVGQWTAPFTGTVMAALSGRQLVQILCKKDRRPFVSKVQNG